MSKITIFPCTVKADEPYHVDVSVVVHRIRTGAKNIPLIQKIRVETDPKQKLELKKKLPNICFSGTFSHRANKDLIEHSGLVAIDFDHLGERLGELKNRMKSDKFTHIAFISPSGDGLKVIVKIPASVKTHALSCDALSDYYGEESLDEFKEVARVCFESYDPDIYYNPDSEIFTTLKEKQTVKRTIETVDIITDFNEIFERIVIWKDKGDHYIDGNKHKYLVSLAGACVRFGIPEIQACQMAMLKFLNAAGHVDPKDYTELFKRVYKNYGYMACTAHFTKSGTAVETLTKTVLTEAVFDITLPLKDIIYLDNVRDSMLQTFHTGRARGETTYFKSIDEHWRWKRKHLVLFHGIMNHGKSAFLMQLCLIKSVKQNYKWAFFSPEQDPPDDFYDDLVHSFIGKNTQPFYGDQMSEAEYISGMDFIKDHFFYIFPDEEAPNQEYINRRFEEIIRKHNVNGCIIDPYNQLDNDIKKFNGREDQYLSSFLTIQKRFAQAHDIFMIIVTHPRGNLTKNNAGDYNCPDVYDLAGGAMWGNKSDDIVCIHRPFFSSNRTDTTVKFISQKIKKRKLCGSPGEVILDYDLVTNRFVEIVEDKHVSPFGSHRLQIPGEVIKSYYEKDEPEEYEPMKEPKEIPF